MAPWDRDDAEVLFREAKKMLSNTTALIVHHLEISIAYACGVPLKDPNVYIATGELGVITSFEECLEMALQNHTYALIVWYKKPVVGLCDVPKDTRYSYFVLEERGNMVLYIFSKV